VLEVHAKFGGAHISLAAGAAKNVEFYLQHFEKRKVPVFKLLVSQF